MSEGQGNIIYGSAGSGSGGGGIAVAGARNGLTIEADGFIVLGQDISEAGDPGQLLSNREIPNEGFYLDFFGDGGMVSADVQTPGDGTSKLILETSRTLANMLTMLANPPADIGEVGYMNGQYAGQTVVELVCSDTSGTDFSFLDPFTGDTIVSLGGQDHAASASGTPYVQVTPTCQWSTGVNLTVAFEDSTEIVTTGGTNTFKSFSSNVNMLSNLAGDTFVGFDFQPAALPANPAVIAFRNNAGNIFFGTNSSGNHLTKVAIRNGAVVNALLQIGAGLTTPGNAPLKLTPSAGLLTIPENGAFEFDGTHLYFTIGAIRTILV